NLLNGPVGINTTTPVSKLSINGGLHVGGDSDAGDNNLLVDGTATVNALVLGGNPSIISSANVIHIKPSGDADDYLEYYTSSDIPIIKRIGGSEIYIESDSGTKIELALRENVNNYLSIVWDISNNEGDIRSTNAINFRTSYPAGQYIQFKTVGAVPTINTIGPSDLEITSSSGRVGVHTAAPAEEFEVNGDVKATNLESFTWRSADESMNMYWGMAAAGSLVLDGDDDYVDNDGAAETASGSVGTITCWFKQDSLGDAVWEHILVFEPTANNFDMIFFGVDAANQVGIRFRENSINVEAHTAEAGSDGWTFMACTYNVAGDLKVYKDDPGAGADTTVDLSGRSAGVWDVTSIGARVKGSIYQEFKGEICHVILWNAELDQSECEAVFDLGQNPSILELEAGIANEGEILSWWAFTTDATSIYGIDEIDGTLEGNAYINSTEVVGMNVGYPFLVTGPSTVVGSSNVTGSSNVQGNLGVGGDILGSKVENPSGDLYLEFPTGSYLKSIKFGTSPAGGSANVNYNASINAFRVETSAHRNGWWKEHVASIESDPDCFLQLVPSRFYSQHEGEDPNRLRHGLYTEQIAKLYPEMVDWGFVYDDPNEPVKRIPMNYDTRAVLAVTIKELQQVIIEKRILEARVDEQDVIIADLSKRLEVVERSR
ncbi:MAG TPA: hypothetical protein ENH82_11295, partial [bacterium]|nr:hypothetical protein [bacterium]